MTGRLIAVVGPSGVGKDSVIAGIAAAALAIKVVRRTITRAPGLGGEDYQSLTQTAFSAAVKRGDFCLHWGAHGLFYGIPRNVLTDVENGADCLANLSRSALTRAAEVFPDLVVLNVTASPAVLAARLKRRGRETPADIAKRLAQAAKPLPPGLAVFTLANDGPLAATVAAALDVLQPARG